MGHRISVNEQNLHNKPATPDLTENRRLAVSVPCPFLSLSGPLKNWPWLLFFSFLNVLRKRIKLNNHRLDNNLKASRIVSQKSDKKLSRFRMISLELENDLNRFPTSKRIENGVLRNLKGILGTQLNGWEKIVIN